MKFGGEGGRKVGRGGKN